VKIGSVKLRATLFVMVIIGEAKKAYRNPLCGNQGKHREFKHKLYLPLRSNSCFFGSLFLYSIFFTMVYLVGTIQGREYVRSIGEGENYTTWFRGPRPPSKAKYKKFFSALFIHSHCFYTQLYMYN